MFEPGEVRGHKHAGIGHPNGGASGRLACSKNRLKTAEANRSQLLRGELAFGILVEDRQALFILWADWPHTPPAGLHVGPP